MRSCKTCLYSDDNGAPDIFGLDTDKCMDCSRLSNWTAVPDWPFEKDCDTCKHHGTDYLTPGTICNDCIHADTVLDCANWEPRNGIFVQGEVPFPDVLAEKMAEKFDQHIAEEVAANPGMTGQYTFRGGIEPLDFVASNRMDFLEGNVIKYIYRYPNKGGLEALKKAKFYVERLIERWEEDHAEEVTD